MPALTTAPETTRRLRTPGTPVEPRRTTSPAAKPEAPTTSIQPVDGAITELPVALIDPGSNDRRLFAQDKLEELAESIRQNGLAQPITVRPMGKGKKLRYQIVAGERRFRAISTILQWEKLPAIVRKLDDATASAIMLAENLNRVDLNPIEEAQAFDVRIRHLGWTDQQVADAVGISVELVRKRISLLRLVEEAQFLVATAALPLGHAELLVRLDSDRQRLALRTLNNANRLPTLAVWREFVSQLLEEQAQDVLFNLEEFFTHAFAVPEDLPRRGRGAVVGAPTRTDLPPITMKGSDTTADILDRWIAELLRTGQSTEAATVGTLYTALVHGNFMTVPSGATLLTQDVTAAQAAQEGMTA